MEDFIPKEEQPESVKPVLTKGCWIGDFMYMPGEIQTYIKINPRKGIFRLTEFLIAKYHAKTIKGNKREVLIYENGVYVPGEEVLRKAIRDELGELCSNTHVREAIESVKDFNPMDREKFTSDKHMLNLNNGVLDLRTRELKEHSPEYLFFTKIPVDYNPKADCPVIKKFLYDVLDEEHVQLIKEWTGYALYPEYFIKKAIILVGAGDTGKTTLVLLLGTFYGEKNVCGVSLQKMSSDKFSCANLYNKYINLFDDLSFKDINDNGTFKIATGGGIITGEKKFGDQFQFKNYAKLTFACNKIPDVKDADDEAYFKRWIIIPFNYVVEEENKDKQLIHKLTTPEELSGFLNFALDGLDTILKNEMFSYDKNAEEIKAEMLQSGSSIGKFVFGCLEPAEGKWVSKDEMYRAYIQFTRENNLPNKNKQDLGRRLRNYAVYVSDSRPTDIKTKSQVTAWSNVKFKDDFRLAKEEETQPLSDLDDIIDITDDFKLYES